MANKTQILDAPSDLHEWQKAFLLKTDLRQRDVYTFEKAIRAFESRDTGLSANPQQLIVESVMRAFTNLSPTGANITNEHMLKAAIEAGWIEAPEAKTGQFSANGISVTAGKHYFLGGEDVDDMHPGKVRWYGQQVARVYNRAVEAPPN